MLLLLALPGSGQVVNLGLQVPPCWSLQQPDQAASVASAPPPPGGPAAPPCWGLLVLLLLLLPGLEQVPGNEMHATKSGGLGRLRPTAARLPGCSSMLLVLLLLLLPGLEQVAGDGLHAVAHAEGGGRLGHQHAPPPAQQAPPLRVEVQVRVPAGAWKVLKSLMTRPCSLKYNRFEVQGRVPAVHRALVTPRHKFIKL